MSYNARIRTQQGACELTVASGASVNFNTGGRLALGNVDFYFGSDLPTFTASPGAVYFRSDGSISGIYSNRSDGTSGSVWRGASYLGA